MATQNTQGIQILLEAEKEADKIVQKGRQYRLQRLKDAKSEAIKEIEALKAQKQKELIDFEKQHSGTLEALASQQAIITASLIEETKLAFQRNQALVIKNLLEAVVNVKPEIHQNYLFQRQKQHPSRVRE